MYKYYLFDLDGTISQSEPGILNCIRYALDAARTAGAIGESVKDIYRTIVVRFLYIQMSC